MNDELRQYMRWEGVEAARLAPEGRKDGRRKGWKGQSGAEGSATAFRRALREWIGA